MKATLGIEVYNATQPNNKETIDTAVLVCRKDGEFVEAVTVRWYMGRSASASVVYCCVWLRGRSSGYGTAGGYGYHKTSAAFASALSSAGIELHGDPYGRDGRRGGKRRAHIGGCGTESVEHAMMAIGRALGYKGKMHICKG